MKDGETTFVVVIAGTVPPGTDLATAGATVMSALTANLPLTQCMRASGFELSTTEEASALCKRLLDTVAPKLVNGRPKLEL